MNYPSKNVVESLRKKYPAGTRVQLVSMDDPQAPTVGTMGTVEGVDDTGSLLMSWDNGSGLNVVYGVDEVVKTKSYTLEINELQQVKGFEVCTPVSGLGIQSYYVPVEKCKVD